MSDEPEEREEEPPQVADSAPMLSRAERFFVRLTLWQTVLSVVGVFIAIVALYAALTESAAVRQQTAAAVWPFVQFSVEDYDTGDAAGFSMSFRNTGVGPARMQDVRLTIDGEAIRDWRHAASRMGVSPAGPISRNFISDRVLSPDETVKIINTTEPDLARKLQEVIANPENFITYCYCSIFEQCWLADSRLDMQNPKSLAECPDFGDATFRN